MLAVLRSVYEPLLTELENMLTLNGQEYKDITSSDTMWSHLNPEDFEMFLFLIRDSDHCLFVARTLPVVISIRLRSKEVVISMRLMT